MPRFPGRVRTPVRHLVLAITLLAATTLFAAPSAPAAAPDLAQGAAGLLDVAVDARCRAGAVDFRIRNTGGAWPKAATFVVYRLGRGEPQAVAMRRMRLKDGQWASFHIRKLRNPTGRLGLFVEPGWYTRPFALDARVACRG